VPEPSLPGPEAVYEAVRETAVDEPGPVRHDDIRLDEFLRDWNEPENDLESSTVVLDEGGSVVAFTYLNAAGERAQHLFFGRDLYRHCRSETADAVESRLT
jgi:hypothetical protein